MPIVYVPVHIVMGMPMTVGMGMRMAITMGTKKHIWVYLWALPFGYSQSVTGIPMTMCTGTYTIGKHAPGTSPVHLRLAHPHPNSTTGLKITFIISAFKNIISSPTSKLNKRFHPYNIQPTLSSPQHIHDISGCSYSMAAKFSRF